MKNSLISISVPAPSPSPSPVLRPLPMPMPRQTAPKHATDDTVETTWTVTSELRGRSSDLSVARRPRFIRHLPEIVRVADTDDVVRLDVDVDAVPGNLTFTWFCNGFQLRPNANVQLLSEVNSAAIVLRRPVRAGIYKVRRMLVCSFQCR